LDEYNVTPVFLETKKECLISEIVRIIINDSAIYIKDRSSNNVFVFNKDGSFRYKINLIGRGPEEISFLSDLDVYEDCLYLLGSMDKKILCYNSNGKYLKTIKLKEIGVNALNILNTDLFLMAGFMVLSIH